MNKHTKEFLETTYPNLVDALTFGWSTDPTGLIELIKLFIVSAEVPIKDLWHFVNLAAELSKADLEPHNYPNPWKIL